jgi:Cu/Ag efflux protein CusF
LLVRFQPKMKSAMDSSTYLNRERSSLEFNRRLREEASKTPHCENTIKVLVVALTSLAFTVVSFAQSKPAIPVAPAPGTEKRAEMKSEQAQATVLTGQVTSVDAKAGKLTVKTKDKVINMTTDSKTTKAALEKLKLGDTAKVFERGGTVIAASPVKVESKAKAAK